MDAIIQAARQHNLKVVDVPSDGNCGLHAIAHQLSLLGTQTNPITLRHEAVTFLRHNPKLLSLSEGALFHHEGKNFQSADSYLNAISVDGTWVDEITLRAVGACIQRDIDILHDNGHITSLEFKELSFDNVTDTNHSPPIKLGLIGEVHYLSLVKAICDDDDDDNPCTTTHCDWPSVWSEDVWHKKKEQYKFLQCKDGSLGCATCRSVVSLQTLSGPGRTISEEWANCRIQPNGKGRAEQLRSLRKKLCEYIKSGSHISAEKF